MNKIIFKILRFSGLPWLFREFIQNNKASILLFHEINKQTATQTFLYLQKRYNIIDLNNYVKACQTKNKSLLPKKALIITFDDGLIQNYEMLPIIKKYNIPVTIFLCSSIINTNRHFWYKHKDIPIPLAELKKLSNHERLKILAEYNFKQNIEFDQPQALTRKQIIEMAKYVNMQSHTKFHPCLPKCDSKESREEIFGSKKILEAEWGFKINAIAYPNGDYSERDLELTKNAGYDCGLTVDYGFNTLKTDLFRLKRLSVNDTQDLNELAVKSSGLWAFFKMLIGKTQS